MYHNIDCCRACGGTQLEEVLAFGEMPLADRLLTSHQLEQEELLFPLTVVFCHDCSLLQIRETVSPSLLYADEYPYYSSFSDSWVSHCRENALELIEMRNLDDSSLVVEIACNDGYLLKNFVEKGVPVLGIDPAEGPAAVAREAGVEVLNDFFTKDLSARLAEQGQQADVLLGNNVLAHVADLPGFVSGIQQLLKPDGVAVIEVPYVRPLIEKCEFDTIYHEHHCYFSVTALSKLFRRHGLWLNDVRQLSTHGGSLRLYVEKKNAQSKNVLDTLETESELGMDTITFYRTFADRVLSLQKQLTGVVQELKQQGRRLAAYAAAAKGATLLNSSGIGTDMLDYVVDRNEHKHGRYMPGVHLPIFDTQHLLDDFPDVTLLLAWNHKDEILKQQSEYRKRGGRFIIPIPEPVVI